MSAPPALSAAGSLTVLLGRRTVPVGFWTVANPITTITGLCISAHLFPFSVLSIINARGASRAGIRKTRIDSYQYERFYGIIPSNIQSVFLPFRRNSGYILFRILQAKYFINHIIRYFKHKINLSFIFFFCSWKNIFPHIAVSMGILVYLRLIFRENAVSQSTTAR